MGRLFQTGGSFLANLRQIHDAGELTISYWGRKTAIAAAIRLNVQVDDVGGAGTYQVLESTNIGGIQVMRTGVNTLHNTIEHSLFPPDNVWHNVIITYRDLIVAGTPSASSAFYEDGVLGTWETVLFHNDGAGALLSNDLQRVLFIGYATFSIAELGVWNRVLSSNEIEKLAVQRLTPALIPNGLIGAWRILGDGITEPSNLDDSEDMTVINHIATDHPDGIITSPPLTVFSHDVLGTEEGAKLILTRTDLDVSSDPNADYTEWQVDVNETVRSNDNHLASIYPVTYYTLSGSTIVEPNADIVPGDLDHAYLPLTPNMTFRVRTRQIGADSDLLANWSDYQDIASTAVINSYERGQLLSAT